MSDCEVSMNVSLTPKLEKFVQAKVEDGRYTSASEVVREALRLLEQYENDRAARLLEFNSELARRLASLDRGKTVSGSAVRSRFQRRSQHRRRSA